MKGKNGKIKKYVNKRPHYRHGFPNTVIYAITPDSHRDTLIEDVNHLVEKVKGGGLDDDTILELKRVKEEIVIKNQQERVVKECGKESLLIILREVSKIRKKQEKDTPRISPLKMNAGNKNKTGGSNNKLRWKWIKWFTANYENRMEKKLFEEVRNAALRVDFSKFIDKNGQLNNNRVVNECYRLAKESMENEGAEKPKKSESSPTKRYNGMFSQRTTKDYGSAYRPVRIGRK